MTVGNLKKQFQCKHIPDLPILEFLARNPEVWHNWYFSGSPLNVRLAMPDLPDEKLALAKMRTLIRWGLVDGCDCGCRGDFVITKKGLAEIERLKSQG